MKKITLLLFLSAFIGFVNATVYLDETFDYSDGALKDALGWTENGTTSGAVTIGGTGFFYVNAGGQYIYSGVGKVATSAYEKDASISNYRLYSTFTAVNSGTIYMSFLYKAGANQGQSQSDVISFLNDTNNGPRLWAGKGTSNTKVKLGVSRGGTGSANIVWDASVEFPVNDVVFIVLKHDFSTNATSLYLNPTIGGVEPSANAVNDDAANIDATKRTSLNGLSFRHNQQNASNFNVSGIRISSTWAEAVAAQSATAVPLDAPVIGLASNVGAESFTANWTKVDDAIGYTVKVYQGATLYASQDVNDQSAESLDMRDLWVETAYTYTVTAKGDGSDFLNSDESSASTAFTTLEGLTSIDTDFADTDFWGEAADDLGLGNYPSSILNGYTLNAAYYRSGSIDGFRGNKFQNRFAVDKIDFSGSVSLPIVQSVEQIEIFAASGSEGKSFKLEKTTDGITWEQVGIYNIDKVLKAFIIPLSSDDPIKLRISNNTGSALYVWSIITRTTNPALLDAPTVGAATSINATSFYANWSAVDNATGYKVFVYKGTSLVKTVQTTGQATIGIEVSNLDAETTYTYKVLALGDDYVNYADSYVSVASASFETGPLTSTKEVSASDIIIANNLIQAPSNGRFEIFNIQGSRVQAVENAQSVSLNLHAGLYVLRFTTLDGEQLIRKFNIQ